jgi:hypothetical protein
MRGPPAAYQKFRLLDYYQPSSWTRYTSVGKSDGPDAIVRTEGGMMAKQEPMLKLREHAVAWQEIEGETILLDVAASTYLGVNRSGSVLWPALGDGATRRQLIGSLRAVYEITEEQAGTDIDEFLRLCRDRGLLET